VVAELATCALVIRRPAWWTYLAAPLRVLGLAGICWGLITLLLAPAKVHYGDTPPPNTDPRHLILVLDVSPSMNLKDAGPTKKQTRKERAAQVMQSFFERVPIEL
jgi:Ca-activated chloride channel family protein